MSLGSITTSVDFRDSNRVIVIDNTRNVLSSFNRIEINDDLSNVEWTAINISAIGTVAKGEFEAIDDATIDFDTCVFTDMSTFIFQAKSTLLDCTWRRCALITQGGGSFTNCIFDLPTGAVALLSDDIEEITGCTFNSDGTGHAIELTSAHAGQTVSLTDCTFVGYASGNGTTDAVIYNNSGGAVTITTSGVTGTVSYLNGASASTTISSSVPLSVVCKNTSGLAVSGVSVRVEETDGTLIDDGTTDASGEFTGAHTGSTPLAVKIIARKKSYKYIPTSTTIGTTGLSQGITMIRDTSVNLI